MRYCPGCERYKWSRLVSVIGEGGEVLRWTYVYECLTCHTEFEEARP